MEHIGRQRGLRLLAIAFLVVAGAGCGPADGDPVAGIDGAVHRFAELDDTRWHWVEAGSGEPLVLLHGLPETWHAWAPVLPELAGGFRVLALDLEGMGRTDAGDADSSPAAMAARLGALLTHVGVDRFRLVGHDWGGLIGARLAGDQPQRIVAYAHVAAPVATYDLTRLPDYRDFWLDPAGAPRFVGIADVVVDRIYDRGVWGRSEALPPELLQRRIEDFGRAGVAEAVARWFRDLELDESWRLGPSAVAAWERMDFPVLLLIGDRDLLLPSEMYLGIEARIPGPARLAIIDDAGHYPVIEQPQATAETLLEFLTGTASGSETGR